MSSLFGIFNRDLRPVDTAIVQRMLEDVSYWSPDDQGVWVDGPVALGHAMLWNTPESTKESLPRQQSNLVITIDSRLDDREELGRTLGIPAKDLPTKTDSDLILAAYFKWGAQCPEHLLGDFAFAIWDAKKREMFCARDHLGIKQLYFSATPETFLVGSDIKGLLSHPGVTSRINDKAVANFLVNWGLESDEWTFFEDIEKLPPAHTLTISKTELRKTCYWQASDSPRIRYADEKEYSEQLRALLEKAVHDRLRSAYPVSSHLSGGLDSSSIAVIAARRLREQGKQLLAFNWLHEPSESDDSSHYEWSSSKTIAEHEAIAHRYVDLDVSSILRYLRERTVAYGDSTLFWYEYPVRETVSQSESRTILSGWGGDELVSYHGQAYYSDLLLHGRFLTLLKALSESTRGTQGHRPKRWLSTLYHHVFLVLAPRSLYCHLPRSRCEERSLPFVKPSFMSTVREVLEEPTSLSMQPQRTIRRHMLAYLENGHIQNRIESWATTARSSRVEYAYPLLDKRIVEFALGVPGTCFIQNGKTRYLFRSALEGLLPDELLWSSSKLEINRVRRLIALVGSSYETISRETGLLRGGSEFIDVDKLLQAARDASDLGVDVESAYRLMDLETAFAVACSKELNDPDGVTYASGFR